MEKIREESFKIDAVLLRRRLFIYFAFALLCLAILLFGTTSWLLIDHLKKAEDTNLYHSAEIRSLALAQWCRRAKDLALQITSRSRIREELEKYDAGETPLNKLRDFTSPKLADAMALSKDILGIIRLDNSNNIVAECEIGAHFTNIKELCEKYGNEDSVVLSPPILLGSTSAIIVITPIHSASKKHLGTDLVALGVKSLHSLTCVGENKRDKHKIFLTYPSNNGFSPVCPNKDHSPLEDFPFLAKYFKRALTGGNGITHEGSWTIAYVPISGVDWSMVVMESHEALYSPIRARMLILIGFFALIYMIVLSGFWLLMKPLAGKLLIRVDELEDEVEQRTKEKENVIKELQSAIDNIHTLHGLLPICSYCKKIRDDEGYWNRIEVYIRDHSDANFSHSVCPECLTKHFPKYAERAKKRYAEHQLKKSQSNI